MNWRAVRAKLEFGDFLIAFYALVFVRQCFWGWGSNLAAWGIASALTILLWLFYLHTKSPVEIRTPRAFWLIVGLPLFLIYALRAPFPDLSFDVLNHRLIQGERALHWAPFLPNDFFPTIFPFNPSPDMLTGISRMLLGYRLGTIINLMVLLWAGAIINKLLRPFIAGALWRNLALLLVLFTEHILFEINNYMVDLLALPLLLEATRLALKHNSENPTRDVLFSAVLLGMATGLKLTNVALAVPIMAIFALQHFRKASSVNPYKLVLFSIVLFLIPLMPHAIYIYRETGNPVFPFYNNLIKSPFWPPISPGDGRWGPSGVGETILWPLLSVFVPRRLSELGVYAGRISLASVAALLCLLLPRIDLKMRLVAGTTLCGSIFWSVTSGYIRYALFLEILGGILVIYLAYYALKFVENRSGGMRFSAATLPLLLLTMQCGTSLAYALQSEWSMRPTVLQDPSSYRTEMSWLLRDRKLPAFLSPATKEVLSPIEAWIVSSVKTNGIQVLLRDEVPMLAIHNSEYFNASESSKRFQRTLSNLRGKRLFSLILSDHLEPALETIEMRGLETGEITTVIIPFFSQRTRVHMTLIEIKSAAVSPCKGEASSTSRALPEDAFKALILVAAPPTSMRPGEQKTVYVSITNISEYVWPARGEKSGRYYINIGNSWLSTKDESLINNMDGRSSLLRDLCPAQTVDIPLTITAPGSRGDYILEIDMVQEGVAWFKEKASETLKLRVSVD